MKFSLLESHIMWPFFIENPLEDAYILAISK